jgi:hypothetical protein
LSNTVCDKHAGFARYRLGGCIHVGSLLVNRLKVLVAELKEARPFRAERSHGTGTAGKEGAIVMLNSGGPGGMADIVRSFGKIISEARAFVSDPDARRLRLPGVGVRQARLGGWLPPEAAEAD